MNYGCEINNEGKNNGKIDLLNFHPAHFQEKPEPKKSSSYKEAMSGRWENTTLSIAYFSKENIQIIQNAIRYGVYLKSNKEHIISEQSGDELKIIMRAMFLEHSKNNNENIPEQISELNDYVIKYCVNTIYGELIGYLKYLKDTSTLVVPLDRPVLGRIEDKNLEFKGWF